MRRVSLAHVHDEHFITLDNGWPLEAFYGIQLFLAQATSNLKINYESNTEEYSGRYCRMDRRECGQHGPGSNRTRAIAHRRR